MSSGAVAAVADGGHVVGEGVEPDVDDVLGVAGDGDAPLEAGAGDGEVVEGAGDVGGSGGGRGRGVAGKVGGSSEVGSMVERGLASVGELAASGSFASLRMTAETGAGLGVGVFGTEVFGIEVFGTEVLKLVLPRRKLRTSLRRASGWMRSCAGFDEVDEGELVGGEAEEVVLFGDGFGGRPHRGSVVPGGPSTKAFVRDAVLAGVGAEIDVAAVFEDLEELLDAALVARVRWCG